MSFLSQQLASPADLPSFLSQLNGSYDQLSVTQTRDLLQKIENWRSMHAETEFRHAQNMYNDVRKRGGGNTMSRSDESLMLLETETYDSSVYDETEDVSHPASTHQPSSSHSAHTQNTAKNGTVTELKRKKQELMNLLERGQAIDEAQSPKHQNETSSDHIPRQSTTSDTSRRRSSAPAPEANSGILTVSANTTEADIHGEYQTHRESFKKPKKPKITIPKPFSFDKRERTRRKMISERRFEEYIDSIQKKEDDLVHHRFVAQPVPASTLQPKYKELQEQSKARSDEIKEMSKKWLLKNQRPFGFMQTNTYDEQKKRNLEKIKKESRFVKRPFKANPLPEWIGDKMMHQFEAENVAREKRVKERSLRLYEESKLPPRMEMWKGKEQELNKSTDSPNRRHSSSGLLSSAKHANPNFTFQPKVNTSVPNFCRLQKEFEQELKKRKEAQPLTSLNPPKCADSESLSKSRLVKILTDIKEDEENLPENRWPYLSKRRPEKPNPHPDFSTVPKTPDKTRTILMREELVKKHLEKLHKEEERRKWEEEHVWFNPKLTSTSRKSLNNSGEHSHQKKRPTSANPRLSQPASKSVPNKEEIKRKVLKDVCKMLERTGDEDLMKRVAAL
uniref:Uncharacterized protein n=1 Tax=Percolomonas cosmopolitus TaxID=63605 RepID=A0A7S1PIP3_9EUKA|mmetsp:Transcript_7454/g.27922  ORF Transcript_7454/g.27922 Transcript_7454/m.27922 type:complete len:619 (+) Transcript_7454:290-2146(+)